jgi:hypothetical protein
MQPYGPMLTQQLAWRRASFCANGECVELAEQDGTIIMRNSAHPAGPALHYTAEEFGSFVRGIKAGEFDDLAE